MLDVVFNHTGEGNEMGPTLSFRGIDNPSYYTLTGPPEQPRRYYMNFSGCGNTLDFDSPAVVRIGAGFAAVLGAAHARRRIPLRPGVGVGPHRQQRQLRLHRAVLRGGARGPGAGRAILIAEPWDTGTYQVGNFPVDWSEWNGRFRDTLRRFTKRDAGQLPDLGHRLTGSADLYGDDGRSAYNSINFVTCHDGFTLHDLLAYNGKHNDANGENNRDGSDDNNSWNCGAEGDTDDVQVVALRRQLAKNHYLSTAFRLRYTDAARRRRVPAHTAGQQQRLLPGQRDLMVRLGAAPNATPTSSNS